MVKNIELNNAFLLILKFCLSFWICLLLYNLTSLFRVMEAHETRELLVVAGRAGMGKSSLVKLLCPNEEI